MACQEQFTGFKYEVISKLRCRNENERARFEDVINLSKLFCVLVYHILVKWTETLLFKKHYHSSVTFVLVIFSRFYLIT